MAGSREIFARAGRESRECLVFLFVPRSGRLGAVFGRGFQCDVGTYIEIGICRFRLGIFLTRSEIVVTRRPSRECLCQDENKIVLNVPDE